MSYIGFIGLGYVVSVFIGTGILLLLTDVKAYQHAGLKKERKTAKILGWTNLSLGVILFIADWMYEQWSW